MAMTMSLGVEFVMKDSFSGPASKVASSFSQLRAAVGGVPQMSAQFNDFGKTLEKSTEKILRGGGGGGGKKGKGGLEALEDMGGKLVTSFMALKGAAAGMDMFQEPLANARAFGVEMGQIRTIINEDALSTDAARDATYGLAYAYGTDATTAAKGLYETISAGVTDATKATDLLRVANELAIGGNTELGGAIDILTSSVNTYSSSGLSARDASDQLFVAIAAGKTTAAELSASLGQVAPTASAAGISFRELTGSIAALTVQGIATPQAVTGLNALISNIAKPTKEASVEARRLGIAFNLTSLKAMGLQKFLAQIATNAKVNVETFPKLFGSIDGIKSALALTAEGGKKYNEVMKQMNDSNGATSSAFNIMAEKSDFQYKRFDALKKNAMTLIGEALEPLAVSALKFGSTIIAAFNDLPKGVRDGIVKAVAIAGSLLAAGSAIIGFAAGIGAVVAQVKALGITLAGVGSAVGPLLGVLAAIGFAVAGVKYAYETNIWGIGDTFRGMVDNAKLAFDALGQLFSTGEIRGEAAGKLMDPANKGVMDFVTNVYTSVSRIQEFFNQIGTGFDSAMKAAGPTFEAFRTAIEDLKAEFGGMNETMSSADNATAFDEAGAKGKSFGETLGNIAAIMMRVLTGIVQFATGAMSAWDSLKEAFGPIGEAISGALTPLSELAANFSTASDSGKMFASIGHFIVEALAGVIRVVGHVLGTVTSMFRGMINIIMGIVDFFDGLFHGRWSQMWRGVARIVYGVVTTVVGMVGGMVQAIMEVLDDLLSIFGVDLGGAKAVGDFKNLLDKEWKMALGLEERPRSPEPPEQVMSMPEQNTTVDMGDPNMFGTVASAQEMVEPTESPLVVVQPEQPAYVAPTETAGTTANTAATSANAEAMSAVASSMDRASAAMEAAAKKPPPPIVVQMDGQKVAQGVQDANDTSYDLSYAANPD